MPSSALASGWASAGARSWRPPRPAPDRRYFRMWGELSGRWFRSPEAGRSR